MGREVRSIKPGWEHPKDGRGQYIPLLSSVFSNALADWQSDKERYGDESDFEENYGEEPHPSDYMPEWTEEEATHYALYENVSEGTPMSPAFATKEELARWLADNSKNLMGRPTSNYETWLKMVNDGYVPSFIMYARG